MFESPGGTADARRPSALLIVVLLTMLTFAAYWQAPLHDFLNYDDDEYITKSPYTLQGPTAESVRWAFSETITGNWHPLTRISHMIGSSIFGLNPAGHHAMNVVIHAANAALLFLVLNAMTGASWRSAIVSALFAVHPLHVESVAWISARKDVLSTFFWFAAIGCYARYAKSPSIKRYVPVFILAALGLMSKPMVVTLPATLLLLDIWPLRRMTFPAARDALSTAGKLVLEKIPLFALSAGLSVITFVLQRQVGVVGDLQRYPLGVRLTNCLVSYVTYLRRAVWPMDLALIYPYPKESPPLLITALAAGFLLVLTAVALRTIRNWPYLFVGWAWYLGTLVPVIGIVQVGSQALADRYTYIPMLGIYVAAVWFVADGLARFAVPRWVPRAATAAVLIAFTSLTIRQNSYWQDSFTVFERTLAVTEDNVSAHVFLARAYAAEGDWENSAVHLYEAMRIEGEADPSTDSVEKFYGIGSVAQQIGRWNDAERFYTRAIELEPYFVPALNGMTSVCIAKARAGEDDYYRRAHLYVRRVLNLNPDNRDALSSAALLALHEGYIEQARQLYDGLLRDYPDDAGLHRNMGLVLEGLARYAEAITYAKRAVALDPNLHDAQQDIFRYKEALENEPAT